jgi:uncharacterized protein YecT (DUF1311 family)
MSSRRVISTIALAALFAAGCEQPTSGMSPEGQTCMDHVDLGAFKETQWAACYQSEFQRQDARLNLEYKKLRAKLTPDAAQALVLAQRQWLQFRGLWCDFDTKKDPGHSFDKPACMAELTEKQADLLAASQ